MSCGRGAKYSKDELIRLLTDMDFSMDFLNGKQLGKGDHVVYSHSQYKDLKIVIPNAKKDLNENEMSNICSNLVIIMKILGMDTSIFKRKEGIEGKLKKTVKNAEKDIFVLFTPVVKHCLGVNSEKEILMYIKKQMEKYQKLDESSTTPTND